MVRSYCIFITDNFIALSVV